MTASDGKTLKEAGTAQPVRVIGFKGMYVNLLFIEAQSEDGIASSCLLASWSCSLTMRRHLRVLELYCCGEKPKAAHTTTMLRGRLALLKGVHALP